MAGVAIRILGWDEECEGLRAEYGSPPRAAWFQDFGDAYYAALVDDVDLAVPSDVYAECVAAGEAPAEPMSKVRLLP
jgi:hypothetical protein